MARPAPAAERAGARRFCDWLRRARLRRLLRDLDRRARWVAEARATSSLDAQTADLARSADPDRPG